MSRPFYITTPIYYVNDRPHVGHAYTTIAADMLARFHRMAGRDSFFLTGTDEHGDKIAEAAAAAGLSEIEFCDKTVETFKRAWKNLDIEYDYFIRTTSERHKQAVRKILDAMRGAKTEDGRDVIYSDYYEGLYCTGCEKFLTEKELVDGNCPDHNVEPKLVKEKNYFFRLTAFLPKIRKEIESGELLILPEERRREVLGLINQNLPDFSLSRERVKWGIPLSFDDSQMAYVWVDALSNYISAIGYEDDPDSFKKWWLQAETVHLMAKEILKFHCLYWPAMLLAAGLSRPNTIYLHGFFTVDGIKMSKTVGNMIDPNDLVPQFGPDGTRYLLLTQYPFGIDGDLKVNRFTTQYNSDLANDLGNLISRVVKLIVSNFDGKLPPPSQEINGVEDLMKETERLPGAVYEHIKAFRLSHAISESMNLVRSTNKFFNDRSPWILAREGDKDKLGGILYACCEVLRVLSIMLFPIMPRKMRELRNVFGLDDSTLTLEKAQSFFELQAGTTIKLEQPIFPRLSDKKQKAESSEQPAATAKESDGLLDISDFKKATLIVAEVKTAERIEGADRILRLTVDIGSEERQIVAGIAKHYTPEDIIGKKIVVVANLKPVKIRGLESNGMLLAASRGKELRLLTLDGDLPPGAKVS